MKAVAGKLNETITRHITGRGSGRTKKGRCKNAPKVNNLKNAKEPRSLENWASGKCRGTFPFISMNSYGEPTL